MAEWISVNTPQISRIGYNAEVKTMFIDFCGSKTDTPYINIPEEIFREFSQAKRIDDYYENRIKKIFEQVDTYTDNSIMCKL